MYTKADHHFVMVRLGSYQILGPECADVEGSYGRSSCMISWQAS